VFVVLYWLWSSIEPMVFISLHKAVRLIWLKDTFIFIFYILIIAILYNGIFRGGLFFGTVALSAVQPGKERVFSLGQLTF